MRKTSYTITFVLVAVTFVLTISASQRNDWLIVRGKDIFSRQITVRYGLAERCERQVLEIPSPTGDGTIAYTDYKCRPFPASVTDRCEKGNRYFCTSWTTAAYVSELGIGFGALALLAIVFGVSTHSRRRRIWKAVAGLVALQAVFPMITFAIATDLYRTAKFWEFEHATLGPAWYMNIASWVAAYVIAAGVMVVGVSANKGHRWAAGNRAYHPIEG
ncbi:hypothetical protein OF83DRAFT_466938 [Amylostereum chailletii]|nr:hypothetical protein OF83DRAFT_466938 [Amylostereum chailletii]